METIQKTSSESSAHGTNTAQEPMSTQERNDMIEQYLPLVKKIAGSVIRNHSHQLDYDDLVTAGVLGLVQAIENYDSSYEVSFAGYCQLRVRGSMYDELQRLDWVPRHVRRQQKEIQQAKNRLKSDLNRVPEASEIAEEIEIPLETLQTREKKNTDAKMIPLSRFAGKDENDWDIQDERCSLPQANMDDDESLREYTKGLTKIEQLILTLYYKEELNMQQIGLLRGVSESRICQIHSQLIKQLKPKFEDRYTGTHST